MNETNERRCVIFVAAMTGMLLVFILVWLFYYFMIMLVINHIYHQFSLYIISQFNLYINNLLSHVSR